MLKQALYTAAMVVAMTTILNQFDATKQLISGGNKFFG